MFSPGNLVSSTYETDSHDIMEILLKVALNTLSGNYNFWLPSSLLYQLVMLASSSTNKCLNSTPEATIKNISVSPYPTHNFWKWVGS